MKNNIFNEFEVVWRYGVRGSRFSHIFGRSPNVPKSIAIDQEPLISHSGTNKAPETPL